MTLVCKHTVFAQVITKGVLTVKRIQVIKKLQTRWVGKHSKRWHHRLWWKDSVISNSTAILQHTSSPLKLYSPLIKIETTIVIWLCLVFSWCHKVILGTHYSHANVLQFANALILWTWVSRNIKTKSTLASLLLSWYANICLLEVYRGYLQWHNFFQYEHSFRLVLHLQ